MFSRLYLIFAGSPVRSMPVMLLSPFLLFERCRLEVQTELRLNTYWILSKTGVGYCVPTEYLTLGNIKTKQTCFSVKDFLSLPCITF